MYRAADGEHQPLDGWPEVFQELGERWSDPQTPWTEVRPGLREGMLAVSSAPDATALDAWLTWLDNDVTEDDRRGLIDDRQRETLLRRSLAVSDERLHTVFLTLYQPIDGSLYWTDETTLVRGGGEWRDWTDNYEQAGQLGLRYWDGARYLVLRDGQWVSETPDPTPAADPDAPARQQGWTDDYEQAARLDIRFRQADGTDLVLTNGAWVPADAPAAAPVAVVADTDDLDELDELDDEQDVTNLLWVTAAQADQLDEVNSDQPWAVWLPGELDDRVPDWTTWSPADLTARLDTLIPLLVLPSSDDLIALAGEMTQHVNNRLEAEPDMAALLAEFDENELAEMMEIAMRTGGAA
jgi:hypothetical protein